MFKSDNGMKKEEDNQAVLGTSWKLRLPVHLSLSLRNISLTTDTVIYILKKANMWHEAVLHRSAWGLLGVWGKDLLHLSAVKHVTKRICSFWEQSCYFHQINKE